MDQKLYLTDPGIYKKNNCYFFKKGNAKVTDQVILKRLNEFVVPPAWRNVWYSSNKKSHIQVHGIDQSGKKQYILSKEWIDAKTEEKFIRMKKFVRLLPSFKKMISMNNQSLLNSKETLINLLFNLLLDTHIRVGNEIYADKNKTYGLTTLKQKHLILERNGDYRFVFVGKSKQIQNIEIPKCYNNLFKKLFKNEPNKPLFYYSGDYNNIINSEELNDYLKSFFGGEYSCKDFRTYSANVLFIESFLKNCKIESNPKKIIISSMDYSALKLGHTRNISKKSYISSHLVDYSLRSFEVAKSMTSSELLTKVWNC